MAKFGHTFLSGIVWIVIGISVGILGSTVEGIFGWILTLAGFGFASFSVWLLIRVTSSTIKGMRMAKEDLEEWARIKRNYEDAVKRLDEK